MPEKNKKPLQHFQMQADKLEIYCFEDIDSYFGFSSKDLMEQLKDVPKDTPIEVYINSYGGEVYQGIAIHNILSGWQGTVTTICTGIAASVASCIFLAGDKRLIYDNAVVMIHNPFFGHASGDSEELTKAAEMAKKSENDFLGIYAKTGQDQEQLRSWMKAETYFDAQEAVQYGFATEVIGAPEVVARELSLSKLAAKLNLNTRRINMDPKFKTWLEAYCEPLGLNVDDLDDPIVKKLEARWKKETKTPTTSPTPPNSDPDDLLAQRRQQVADDYDRVSQIEAYVSQHGNDPLNEDYVTSLGTKAKTVRGLGGHAIRSGWTFDKFELEAHRASIPDLGPAAVHTNNSSGEINPRAISAALCRDSGIPSRKKGANGEFGTEVWFDEKTLEASDRYSNLGLLGTMDMMYQQAMGFRYHGRLNTDGFISGMREALYKLRATGNTTWTGLNVFDDLANKILWAAYENQSTTWQSWVTTMSVNDFKTTNMYRLSMTGGYRQVGADGELKHGGLTDAKYTVAANTYGKIVGLSRRDIINDDLGALSSIMTALGTEGAKFLEELFYLTFMNNLTTIFPTAGTYNNYISGAATALGVDGLSAGEKAFMDQVDDDSAPLMVNAEILLVGTALSVKAKEIYEQANLQGVQTANAKGRPDGNPHVGKFQPVVSPYLNNTNILQRTDVLDSVGSAIPNQSATMWFLLPRPVNGYGAIITGAFLNGKQRPTVEQGDPAFDVLGLQWRAYHDAGAGLGDPKLGVMSKGAA